MAESGHAHIGSGSWLIATAAHHPWPLDRLALAESHFRAAVGSGDDFSAWLGVAVVQAARNGGFLRNNENVNLLGQTQVYYNRSFLIPSSYRDQLVAQFRNDGVDDAVLQPLAQLWP